MKTGVKPPVMRVHPRTNNPYSFNFSSSPLIIFVTALSNFSKFSVMLMLRVQSKVQDAVFECADQECFKPNSYLCILMHTFSCRCSAEPHKLGSVCSPHLFVLSFSSVTAYLIHTHCIHVLMQHIHSADVLNAYGLENKSNSPFNYYV